MTAAGFRITNGKGFQVTFANGYTVSVQFGPGNYCSHYHRSVLADSAKCGSEGSPDAETACWGPDGEMLVLPWYEGDMVQSRQSPADVLRLLTWAAEQPREPTP